MDKDRKDTIRHAFVISLIFLLLSCLTISAFFDDSPTSADTYTHFDAEYVPPTLPSYTYAPIPAFTIPTINPYEPDKLPEIETHEIILVQGPGLVRRNETAVLRIKGEPYTMYSITVIYPSGESTARGLDDKRSDKNGYVTWQWKIGGQTSFGTHRAVITDGVNTITVYFQVSG